MKLIDISDLKAIIGYLGLAEFTRRVIDALEKDFARWNSFKKSARHATQYANGVIELMPCSNDRHYAFKYVNGHPVNPLNGKLSVVALGMLTDVESGYPLLVSEMTLLTAFRTAGTAALAAKYLAKPDSEILTLVGTGAQAEFQVNALLDLFPLQTVRLYDPDSRAMDRFESHLYTNCLIKAQRCRNMAEAVSNADIIVTATANRCRTRLFGLQSIQPGVHINALGGDCPGKTEIDPQLVRKSKVVVEFLAQSRLEGEIQNLDDPVVHGELWELVSGHKCGRETEHEITIFDSVGFALEDFSILKLVFDMAGELDVGTDIDLIPQPDDPKNLFGVLEMPNRAETNSAININVR